MLTVVDRCGRVNCDEIIIGLSCLTNFIKQMKQLTISILLVLAVFAASAQQSYQVGIYTEGAWFMPKEFSSNSNSLKNGFGVGAGIYVSSPIWEKLSAVAGLGYRFKESKSLRYHVEESSSRTSWTKFSQNYLVIPVKLQYPVTRHYFVETGVDISWLLNYKQANEKPELDWLVGFGSKKHRLQWSVSYKQGFSWQGFVELIDDKFSWQVFRNRMLVLNLSYPLWK